MWLLGGLTVMQTSAVVAGLSKAVGTAPLPVRLAAGLELALLLTHAQVKDQKEKLRAVLSSLGRGSAAARRRPLRNLLMHSCQLSITGQLCRLPACS